MRMCLKSLYKNKIANSGSVICSNICFLELPYSQTEVFPCCRKVQLCIISPVNTNHSIPKIRLIVQYLHYSAICPSKLWHIQKAIESIIEYNLVRSKLTIALFCICQAFRYPIQLAHRIINGILPNSMTPLLCYIQSLHIIHS